MLCASSMTAYSLLLMYTQLTLVSGHDLQKNDALEPQYAHDDSVKVGHAGKNSCILQTQCATKVCSLDDINMMLVTSSRFPDLDFRKQQTGGFKSLAGANLPGICCCIQGSSNVGIRRDVQVLSHVPVLQVCSIVCEIAVTHECGRTRSNPGVPDKCRGVVEGTVCVVLIHNSLVGKGSGCLTWSGLVAPLGFSRVPGWLERLSLLRNYCSGKKAAANL